MVLYEGGECLQPQGDGMSLEIAGQSVVVRMSSVPIPAAIGLSLSLSPE